MRYTMPRLFVLGLVLLLSPAGAEAQERDVLRQTFHNFFDSNITVEIATESAGEIRVIRGARGRVEVAGHARDGIASFGLDPSGRRSLTLTAIGSGPVSFILVVPEEVRVHLRLPGHRRTELVGSMRRSASYTWSLQDDRAPARTLGPAMATSPATLEQGPAPALLHVRRAAEIDRLTVRLERNAAFSVTGPLATAVARDHRSLTLDAAAGTDEIVVVIPAATRALVLTIDGRPALEVVDGHATNRCDPYIEQRTPAGAQWFTYTPVDGLACGDAPSAPAQRSS